MFARGHSCDEKYGATNMQVKILETDYDYESQVDENWFQVCNKLAVCIGVWRRGDEEVDNY